MNVGYPVLSKLAKKIKAIVSSNEPPLLQEHFFRQALSEVGISRGSIELDHFRGRCWHKATGWVPLVFPNQLIRQVASIDRTKSREAFFMGMIYEGREWVNDYEQVSVSDYGRQVNTKYKFHQEYYEGIACSKYALAPTGDCPWSYRFFEGIMCHAIPVLGDEDRDVFADKFHYFRHSQDKSYSVSVCEENFRVLMEHHTLEGVMRGV